MANLPDMAGAAGEIQLNGSVYRLSPLRLSEFAEFERWVDDEPIRRARRNLDGLSFELQSKMLEQAQNESRNAARAAQRQDRIAQQMASVEGVGYLIWLSLRQNHPELELDTLTGLISLDNLPYIQQRLDDVNGLNSPSPKRAAPRKRAKAQQR